MQLARPLALLAGVILLTVPLGLDAYGGSVTAGPVRHYQTRYLGPGKRPEPVIVDAARHRVYIGTETGGSVVVLNDRSGRIVKTIHVGREVEDLALGPAGVALYAVSSVRSRLSVIDTQSLRLTGTVRLPDASGVALDPSRHRLYVTESNANRVAVLDTSPLRLIRALAVPGNPQGIGIDTALHRVFIGLFARHRVMAISEQSNRVIGSVPVGSKPVHPFRVDSAAHRLYLLNSGSSTLSIVNTRALRVVRTLRTAPRPEGLDVQPARNRAYISNEGDPGTDRNSGHTASVVDLRRGTIIATLPTLQGPDGIAYDGNNGKVYIATEDHGRIVVITLPIQNR